MNLLLSEDFALFDKLSQNEAIRLRLLKEKDPNSPYYLFTQAEIKLQWAIIKLKYGNKLAAVWSLRQAYKILVENEKKFPDFTPNKKSLGLLQVVFGAVPQKYQWAMNIIGLKGDLTKGLQNIREVIEQDRIYDLEARIYEILVRVYILEETETVVSDIMKIKREVKENLLFDFVSSMVLAKTKHSQEALQIVKQIPKITNTKIPYLNYLRGELELYNGNYKTSQMYYKAFLADYSGKNFIKDTYYKLFLADWLEKCEISSLEKEKHFELIQNNGFDLIEVDKYAMKFVESEKKLQIDLMRARLFFDGGHFEKSLLILSKISEDDLVTLSNQTELVYRKARAFHELKKEKLAIEFYKKTILLGKDLPEYFAAYAALQLGYLFQKKEEYLAKKYFERALNFPNQEYKSSIDNKAKAALKKN